MSYSPEIQKALAVAWHPDTADKSLARWFELSHQENWKLSVDALALMTSLFGASWYFTRFVSIAAIKLFDFSTRKCKMHQLSNHH